MIRIRQLCKLVKLNKRASPPGDCPTELTNPHTSEKGKWAYAWPEINNYHMVYGKFQLKVPKLYLELAGYLAADYRDETQAYVTLKHLNNKNRPNVAIHYVQMNVNQFHLIDP